MFIGNIKNERNSRMDRKLRYVWWFVIVGLVILAIWKLFLPHGSDAYLQKTVSSREIVVYVAGAVEKPDLVHLPPDARLDDALKQVRLLPEADLANLNPAEKLKDGQKVSVPYKNPALSGTTNSSPATGAGAASGAGSALGTGPAGGVSSGTVSSSVSAGGKINVNTAGAEELDKLSGVGPALAARIIQYRTEHGPFARPGDLENVSGIGPKTFEKMSSQVTVSP